MCVAIDAVLAFFASGRAEGIVLECGDGVSYAMPIYQGLHCFFFLVNIIHEL